MSSPPRSGEQVIFDEGGPISIQFSARITEFEVFVTHLAQVSLAAYGLSDELLGSTTTATLNNLALSGESGSLPNEALSLSYSGGFSRVVLTGDPSGQSFVADDVSYSSPIPEPGTAASLFAGLIAVAAGMGLKRRARGRDITLLLLLFCLGGAATAAPGVGTPLANPGSVAAGAATPVTFTAQITDSTVLGSSVNLLKLTASGTATVAAQMNDSGLNGDAAAGDGIYTARITIAEQTTGDLRFAVSAGFRGLLRRVQSETIVVRITGSSPNTVVWTPLSVGRSIGGGNPTMPADVTFQVSSSMAAASISIPPALEGFVTASPASFTNLTPGTTYRLELSFLIPPGSQQGERSGELALVSSGVTQATKLPVQLSVVFGNTVISPDAMTLSQQSLQRVSMTGPGTLTFSGSTAEIAAVVPGKVLALPPGPNMPEGFLGRVVSTTQTNGQVVVTTTEASLAEVIENADVSVEEPLTADRIASQTALAPGVSVMGPSSKLRAATVDNGMTLLLDGLELDDGLFVDGRVSVNPTFRLNWKFRNKRLHYLSVATIITESSELTLRLSAERDFLEKEKEFSLVKWQPIVVWAGPVPVVIRPEAKLVVGIKGTAQASIQFSVSQQSSLTAGVGYDNGDWHWIRDAQNSYDASVEPSLGANLKAYAGPRFKLMMYGVVGPYVDARIFGELDVDLLRVPVWQIYGGIEAAGGVQLRIFDKTIANKDFPLSRQLRYLIKEGGLTRSGKIQGVVRDAVTGNPMPNSEVAIFRDGTLIKSLLTGLTGSFSELALPGSTYRLEISHDGYLPVTYHDITVLPNETKILDAILQIDTAHSGLGAVGGTIVNALTGAGIPNVTVRLRAGMNTVTGPVAATATTGPGGTYSIADLPAGSYTAEATAANYNATSFSVLCIGSVSTGDQDGVMTPVLPPDQTRIVLTWAEDPWDLDSHFTGPLSDGGRFHMYYPLADTNRGTEWPGIVRLDLDDTRQYGPETTTLLTQISGVYRFSVHDYTNAGSTNSTALSNSEAQVRVYRGANLVASFNVPPSTGGTLWTVFEMEGDTITPINTMTYQGVAAIIEYVPAPGRERGGEKPRGGPDVWPVLPPKTP